MSPFGSRSGPNLGNIGEEQEEWEIEPLDIPEQAPVEPSKEPEKVPA